MLSREKVRIARLGANYALHSRTHRPFPDGARPSLSRVKAGAAAELWEAAPEALVREFVLLRLRRVAAAAVFPDLWPSLNLAFRVRADRWEGEPPKAVRRRWLERAALEALVDKGAPPAPWAPDWYRSWSNRVSQILRRELPSRSRPKRSAADAEEQAMAAQVVASWRTRDPLATDRQLLAYLEREKLDEEERELVEVMRETGPNVSKASDALDWSYWRTRRVLKQVQAKGQAAKAADL